jgi:hypothetical protein
MKKTTTVKVQGPITADDVAQVRTIVTLAREFKSVEQIRIAVPQFNDLVRRNLLTWRGWVNQAAQIKVRPAVQKLLKA